MCGQVGFAGPTGTLSGVPNPEDFSAFETSITQIVWSGCGEGRISLAAGSTIESLQVAMLLLSS
jgi:hypothetical protein